MSYEDVLSIFSEYLEEDSDVEALETKHGYVILTWDRHMEDWGYMVSCWTTEVLFEELLESAMTFYERGMRKMIPDRDDTAELTQDQKLQLESMKDHYMKMKEGFQ